MGKALVFATALLLAVALFVIERGVALNADFLHDDAFITLRYAQNWLGGNGIAWNPGDRVEGYTNFLQLVAVTGLGAMGVDLVVATRVVAAASYAALAGFLAAWLFTRDDEGWLGGNLTLAACAGSLPLLAWGFGGLEAPLLSACVTVGIVMLYDLRTSTRVVLRASLGGLALALACMTRPDAGLFLAAGALLVAWPVSGRIRFRVVVAFAIPVLALLVPWLVWKFAYYGSIVPNTFYVKATDPSLHRLRTGLSYIGSYAAAPPFLLPLLVAGCVRALALRRMTAGQCFAGLSVALHLCWVAFVGGDQMPMHRLLVPMIPIVAVLCVDVWLPDLRALSQMQAAAVAIGLAAALGLQLLVGASAERNLNSTAFVGAAVGQHITAQWRPGSLVALNTAGSTPYAAPGFRYVDMLGLNDAHIARREVTAPRIRGQLLPGHAKGDGAYVLDRQPDYIILGPAHGALAHQPWFLSDVEIAEDERFRSGYLQRQKRIDVRHLPNWSDFPETASGEFVFTWFERRPSRVH